MTIPIYLCKLVVADAGVTLTGVPGVIPCAAPRSTVSPACIP